MSSFEKGLVIALLVLMSCVSCAVADTKTGARDVLEHGRQFLGVLTVGRDMLGDTLFTSFGMGGAYYLEEMAELEEEIGELEARGVQNDARKANSEEHAGDDIDSILESAPDAVPGVDGMDVMSDEVKETDRKMAEQAMEALASLEADLEELERDLIVESVKVCPVPAFSCRAGSHAIKKSENVRDVSTYRRAVLGLVEDWKLKVKNMRRRGVNLDISIEIERVTCEPPNAFVDGISSRMQDQRVAFYNAIVTERLRRAEKKTQQ